MRPPLLYVIMPVGSDLNYQARRAAIQEGAGRAGYQTHFPLDSVTNGEFTIQAVKRQIASSAAVLADLTHERPSCYFEVGLAQSVSNQVFIVAERDTVIHQVGGRNSVRFYDSIDKQIGRAHV